LQSPLLTNQVAPFLGGGQAGESPPRSTTLQRVVACSPFGEDEAEITVTSSWFVKRYRIAKNPELSIHGNVETAIKKHY
jgi:hypothetical protein